MLLHSTDGKIGTVTAQTDLAVDGRLDSVTAVQNVTVNVHKNASVGTITANAAGTKIIGEGRVIAVKANADNISVSSKGTKVTAATGTVGVKAGSTTVQPGRTETVGAASSSGGGGGSVSQSEYTITFDANGGSNAPAAVKTEKGVLSALPTAEPIRAGWIFGGWSAIKDDASTKIAAGAKFTANTTVYALWTEIEQVKTPQIAFTDSEGVAKTGAAFLTTDRLVLADETEGAVIRYTTDGTEPTAESTVYTGPVTLTAEMTRIRAIAVKNGMKDSAAADSGSITVTAPVTDYTVTFFAGENGSGSMAAAAVPKNGSGEYTLPENVFVAPKDNVFKAWSVKIGDSAPVEKAPNETIAVTADTTVTAVWREAAANEIKIVGYEPIPALKCDYKGNYLSAYNLPTDVTLKLSNGNTVIGKMSSYGWTKIQGDMGAGNTITVQNTVDSIAAADDSDCIDKSAINGNDGGYFYVTMQIRFTAAEDMLSIDWDKNKTYNWDEDVVVTVKNYKGDADDIKLTAGYGSEPLTVGSGLLYDAAAGTLTIQSEKLLNGDVPSSKSTTLYLGDSNYSLYIYYQTDRSVTFEGISYGSIEYSNISRKKPFTTKATFMNVPAEDVKKASFRFADGTAAENITLTETDKANVYMLTVPFASVKDHLTSSYYSGEYATFSMSVRGVASKNIRLSYMGAPELKLDKSDYYAAENPVITLKNFSFEKTAADAVAVTLGDNAEPLVKGQDYIIDAANKTLTLISEKILGANTLAAAKTVTVTVSAAADEESAVVSVPYKKDRSLAVADVTGLSPYVTAKAALSGSEDGYNGLEVYHNDTRIENTRVNSAFVEIPYLSIKDYLDSNHSVTLTAKLSGVQTPATFTVTYGAVDANGSELPIIAGKIGNNYGNDVTEKQGELPKTYYTGTISLLAADSSTLTVDDWKSMGATIEKKDGDGTQVILGVASTATNWDTGGVKAVVLEGLWSHKDEMLKLFNFEDTTFTNEKTDWPVFTVTLYKAGYKTASVDVVLYKYIY